MQEWDTWWRHQMKTFSALLTLCAGNSPDTDEFPSQRPVTRSFDVFFDLRLNKKLSKLWKRRWFETPSRPLWLHCNEQNDGVAAERGEQCGGLLFCCDLEQTNDKWPPSRLSGEISYFASHTVTVWARTGPTWDIENCSKGSLRLKLIRVTCEQHYPCTFRVECPDMS